MKKNKKYKINEWFRHSFQSLWFLITNSYFAGFKTGKIYKGKLKKLCQGHKLAGSEEVAESVEAV